MLQVGFHGTSKLHEQALKVLVTEVSKLNPNKSCAKL